MEQTVYYKDQDICVSDISVPASSACVERMFSIAGHIFSLKHRRLGIQVFMDLVWLKLNEAF